MMNTPSFSYFAGHTAYELLGVSPTATAAEISAAYRRRMKTGTHPDRGGSIDEAQELGQAYGWLSDHRSAYDAYLSADRGEPRGGTSSAESAPSGGEGTWGESATGTGAGSSSTWHRATDFLWDDEGSTGAGHGVGLSPGFVPPTGYTTVSPKEGYPAPAPHSTRPPRTTTEYPGTAMPQGATTPAPPPPPPGRPLHIPLVGVGPMNPWSIVALVLCFLGGISFLAIPAAVLALHQIRRDGGRGRGLAIAGLVIGALMSTALFGS